MVSRYDNFIGELLLEKAINESFLYYSDDVKKILNKIKSDISEDLLKIERDNIKPDMTFVDLGEEGFFSFITMKNAKKIVTSRYYGSSWADNMDTVVFPPYVIPALQGNDIYTQLMTKSRNEVALGRFVNKIFPKKYSAKEVEDFVNSFKALLDGMDEFELVEGKDIDKWYWYENYKRIAGTLGSSCMAKKKGFFRIYIENEDVCQLLILKDDDRIIGRALVWKINSIKNDAPDSIGEDIKGAEYFMDRQYTIDESDVKKFRNYAEKKGWCFKSYNNHRSAKNVTINGKEEIVKMTVEVKVVNYDKYPYMDTFKRYDPKTGILYNDSEKGKGSLVGQYILESTGGDYDVISEQVYSDYYDVYIDRNRAIYSDVFNDYLYANQVVEVLRGENRGIYPDDYDDVVYIEDYGEYVHTSDCVWSNIENRFIFKDDVIEVVTSVYSYGDVPRFHKQYMHSNNDKSIEINHEWNWFKIAFNKFANWRSYNHILKNLLILDYKDELIPSILAIETYKVEKYTFGEIEYLSKIDAKILGYKIIESDRRLTDKFTYTQSIQKIKQKLLDSDRPPTGQRAREEMRIRKIELSDGSWS